MIYPFCCALESYLLAKERYAKSGDELDRKLLDKAKTKLRRTLEELEGSDYTAALDLLTEFTGSYHEFI